jgi:pyridoxamine 5'-phosphate oxidase
MSLRDMSPALDDPVDALFGFHRRLERDLAALGRLPTHLEWFGLDVAASAAAAGLLHGLGTAAALHHAQEEHELMPLLERRIARPGEREAFRALRQGLEADHREIELLWRSLRRPLEAIAEGLARRLPVDEIRYFRAVWTTHISAEEASLHLLALRHLLPGDRTALARRIRARRERGLRAA